MTQKVLSQVYILTGTLKVSLSVSVCVGGGSCFKFKFNNNKKTFGKLEIENISLKTPMSKF